MSTELLTYCREKLLSHPRALNIRTSLDLAARNSFTRSWAKARFEEQQRSILTLPPNHPYYGRGYLWSYELIWREIEEDEASFTLRIEFNSNTVATPRELILLAAVSESPVPLGKCPRHLFRSTKSRMMGLDRRGTGAVLVALRPLVANVQYTHQGGITYASAIYLPDVVSIEP